MVWPYIIALIAVVAALSKSGVAVAVLGGYAMAQILPDYTLLKFAMWNIVGTFIIIHLREQLAGALVIASGLCYPIARLIGAEVYVGSLPFVLSDIAAILAVLIGSYGGLVSWFDGKRFMGRTDNRRGDCYNYRNTRVEEKGR
jgi:hypothetical protein